VSAWMAACPLDALREGRTARIELEGAALCMLRSGDAVHAVEDRCPHRGARLSEGVAYEGCKVACPDHGWTIDLSSGEVELPERGRVRTFPVQVRDGQVLVDLA
jgi:nitrite reductase (NADH) small subunit